MGNFSTSYLTAHGWLEGIWNSDIRMDKSWIFCKNSTFLNFLAVLALAVKGELRSHYGYVVARKKTNIRRDTWHTGKGSLRPQKKSTLTYWYNCIFDRYPFDITTFLWLFFGYGNSGTNARCPVQSALLAHRRAWWCYSGSSSFSLSRDGCCLLNGWSNPVRFLL